MENKFIIERFEDYLAYQSQNLNEAEKPKIGFLAILGSTDAQNLGPVAAPKIGIKPDTIYSLTIKGENDLMTLGKNRTYENFAGLKEEGKSNPQEDYISIKSGGKEYKIDSKVKAKGNIIADFDRAGVIEIKASNNGLLAFLRACKAMDEATGGKIFSGFGWIGKLLISLGNPQANDESRNSSFLAVSPSIYGANPIRYTGFADVINKGANKEFITKTINESFYVSSNMYFLFEEEGETEKKNPGEAIKVAGDSIADAIRAAHYYYTKNAFSNQFGLYKGFNDAVNKYRDLVGKDIWNNSKKIGRSSYILAILLQEAFNKISAYYPMNYKYQDLVPKCKELLESIGPDVNTVSFGNGKEILKGMLAFYKPEKYPKIPAFDPVLGDFWEALSNALAARAEYTFKSNVSEPPKGQTESGPAKVEGKEKSGKTKYSSGGV
jgi:hypothetical protein